MNTIHIQTNATVPHKLNQNLASPLHAPKNLPFLPFSQLHIASSSPPPFTPLEALHQSSTRPSQNRKTRIELSDILETPWL